MAHLRFDRYDNQAPDQQLPTITVYDVRNNIFMGVVRYRSNWRQFVFDANPHQPPVFTIAALRELAIYMEALMLERT